MGPHRTPSRSSSSCPINVARRFLAEAGVRPSNDGEFNLHYRAALDAAREGKWLDAEGELAQRVACSSRSRPT